MAQQTAVQNLINELKQFKKFPMVDQPTIEAAIEFAELRLEMEREQAFQFFKAGQDSMIEFEKNFEQYFNETFKK